MENLRSAAADATASFEADVDDFLALTRSLTERLKRRLPDPNSVDAGREDSEHGAEHGDDEHGEPRARTRA